jgi:hypothetical protein
MCYVTWPSLLPSPNHADLSGDCGSFRLGTRWDRFHTLMPHRCDLVPSEAVGFEDRSMVPLTLKLHNASLPRIHKGALHVDRPAALTCWRSCRYNTANRLKMLHVLTSGRNVKRSCNNKYHFLWQQTSVNSVFTVYLRFRIAFTANSDCFPKQY